MKLYKKILLWSVSVLLVIVIAAVALFFNEIRSLMSLKKADDYPLYQMTYYGDYGFDAFLETGASSDKEIEAYVKKRLLKGLPISLGIVGDGCSAFVTRTPQDDVLFARNFDFDYTPSMQLITHPKNGYASISTVNLSFAGYSADYLPNGLSFDSFLTLAAPYLPFDGVNEKGVAIALLAVPEVQLPYDENKVTLNTTTAIRLVLDCAATVDEAVELLKGYNIYFSADVDCHYLIADANGDSVIVEYWDGALQAVEPKQDYQIASNFVAYNDLFIGDGYDEFERYNTIEDRLEQNSGRISEDNATSLLAEVGIRDNDKDKLQWSVIYNLTTLKGRIFAHRHAENTIFFELLS